MAGFSTGLLAQHLKQRRRNKYCKREQKETLSSMYVVSSPCIGNWLTLHTDSPCCHVWCLWACRMVLWLETFHLSDHLSLRKLLTWSSGHKPTSASSESKVSIAEGTMPWQMDNSNKDDFKYQYHPGGDKSKAPKDAPSALNTVIVPNVNLPKVHLLYLTHGSMLTTRLSLCTTNTTNGERMDTS